MEVNELPAIEPDVDYTKILPIQQKRTIAFINNFIMNTVSVLNTFCHSCESRLMEFEYKLQKIEASLLILESQLSSISCLDSKTTVKQEVSENTSVESNIDLPEVVSEEQNVPEKVAANESVLQPAGPKASDDPRFMRFFKMIQFGVPLPAVKLKMETEGLDSSILDRPNDVIPGHPAEQPKLDTDSSVSS